MTPQINCCCCGEVLEVKLQEAMYPGGRSFHLVTCLTEGCFLNGFTLASCNYPPTNLDAYLASGKRRLAKEAKA